MFLNRVDMDKIPKIFKFYILKEYRKVFGDEWRMDFQNIFSRASEVKNLV